jgi:hypothetical protein
MRLALRAQNQARATLETLALIKNPPRPTFVKQANIAHGPQQVNNGAVPAPEAPSPAREEPKNEQPQLLEHQPHEQWLDTRAPQTTGASNQALAPVGAIDGTQDTGGAHTVRRR